MTPPSSLQSKSNLTDHDAILLLGGGTKRMLTTTFAGQDLEALNVRAQELKRYAGPYDDVVAVIDDEATLKSPEFKHFIFVVTALLSESIPHIKSYAKDQDPDERIPDLLNWVRYLQTVAISMDDPEFQKLSIKVLEGYVKLDWMDQHLNKYYYVLLLLSKILSEGGTMADVNKIKALSPFILEIDFDDEHARPLALQLSRSCASNYFVKHEEKTNFLRFLLSEVDPKITEEALGQIQDRLPSIDPKQAMLKRLATLLLKAWMASSGPIRLQLERGIDGFVEMALLCEPLIAARARGLLVAVCDDLKNPEVTSLKTRLLEPHVFAYYNYSNFKVRKNCVQLLGYAFPLCDPEDGHCDYNMQLQSQYNQLVKSTSEKHPEVRSAAITGVVRVMCRFWETLPPESTSAALTAIIRQSMLDSVPSVRAEAITGLGQLLNNPFTHEVVLGSMKEVIPAVNDKSSVVRQSMMNLVEQLMRVDLAHKEVLPLVSSSILPRISKEHFQLWNLVVQKAHCSVSEWGVDDGIEVLGHRNARPKAKVQDDRFAGLSQQRKLVGTIGVHMLSQMMSKAEADDVPNVTAKTWHKHLWEFLEVCPLATLAFIRDSSIHIPRTEVLKLLISFWQKSMKEARTAYMIYVDGRTVLHEGTGDRETLAAAQIRSSRHHLRALLGFEMLIEFAHKMAKYNADAGAPLSEGARAKLLDVALSDERLAPFFEVGSDLRDYRITLLRVLRAFLPLFFDLKSLTYDDFTRFFPRMSKFLIKAMEINLKIRPNDENDARSLDDVVFRAAILPLAYRCRVLEHRFPLKTIIADVDRYVDLGQKRPISSTLVSSLDVLEMYVEVPVLRREVLTHHSDLANQLALNSLALISQRVSQPFQYVDPLDLRVFPKLLRVSFALYSVTSNRNVQLSAESGLNRGKRSAKAVDQAKSGVKRQRIENGPRIPNSDEEAEDSSPQRLASSETSTQKESPLTSDHSLIDDEMYIQSYTHMINSLCALPLDDGLIKVHLKKIFDTDENAIPRDFDYELFRNMKPAVPLHLLRTLTEVTSTLTALAHLGHDSVLPLLSAHLEYLISLTFKALSLLEVVLEVDCELGPSEPSLASAVASTICFDAELASWSAWLRFFLSIFDVSSVQMVDILKGLQKLLTFVSPQRVPMRQLEAVLLQAMQKLGNKGVKTFDLFLEDIKADPNLHPCIGSLINHIEKDILNRKNKNLALASPGQTQHLSQPLLQSTPFLAFDSDLKSDVNDSDMMTDQCA